MEYSEKDFDKCKFNPFKHVAGKNRDIVLEFKELMPLKHFHRKSYGKGISKEKIVRWGLMLCQPETPLMKIDHARKRRIVAAHLAGFDKLESDEEQFTEEYTDVIYGRNERVNGVLIEFLRFQNNEDFAELLIYENKLWDSFERLESGANTPAEEEKLMKNIDELKKKIKNLRDIITNKDEDKGLVKEMLSIITSTYIDLSREAVAKALQKGEDPFGEKYEPPYGKEYVFDYNRDINKEMYEQGRSNKSIRQN